MLEAPSARPDSPSGSFFEPAPELDLPQLERRSSYTTMTNKERDTYDTAQAYWGEQFLVTPRSTGLPSERYVRRDARVILVDGFEVAEIPYEEFERMHPELFTEILRYARGRQALDLPGRLIEMTRYVLDHEETFAGSFETSAADGSAVRE